MEAKRRRSTEIEDQKRYFKTSLFQYLKSMLSGTKTNAGIVYLVGFKGVGKSTLLSELHKAVEAMVIGEEERTAYFETPNVYDMPLVDYKRIYERFKANKPFTLFIDNIQEIPEDKEAAHILKRILKDTKTRSNWRVIVATSRHGLFSLVSGDKPLLSSDELQEVYCVNPEESVGKDLFKEIMGIKTEEELSPEHTHMLAHIGYVPAMVIVYTDHLENSDAEHFKFKMIAYVIAVLKEEALQIADRYKFVCIRSLAMISSCKATEIFKIRWTPSTFFWTCLKSAGIPLGEVSVVSPLVQEAVVQYTSQSPNHLLDVVDTMRDLRAERPGNVVGRCWYLTNSRIRKLSIITTRTTHLVPLLPPA